MDDYLTMISAELEKAIVEGLTQDPSMAEYRTWHYKDLPRMTHELMDKFKVIVGEENLYWLTYADYGNSVRGQILISPTGMQNMSEWANGTQH